MSFDANIFYSLVKDTNIEYIGVNLLDETKTNKPNQKNELGNIDYGGTTKTGESVIGLASFDYDTSEIVFDPILKWNVPVSVSLQNAVSIPHAYATVILYFFSLFLFVLLFFNCL